jgi:5-methylcytosine-specific restriction endonuclease McrA
LRQIDGHFYRRQAAMKKIYLNVPYSEKEDAKNLGARWEPSVKKWYVSSEIDLTPFRRWFPSISNPRLTIELVPETCWFSNVRSSVSRQDWDKLRLHTYRQASYCCQICGGIGTQHPVECHEIWDYDDQNLVQTLKGLIALCPACHECKHMGLAQIRGREEPAKQHLAKVNNWTQAQTEIYVFDCFEIWYQRSQKEWKLDISYLEKFGVAIALTHRRDR